MIHLNLIKKHVLRIEAIKKITSGLLLLSFIMIFMGGTAAAQTTFTVSNTDDSGTGSFRWAIEQANSEAGSSIISFNIPGSGPHTILISTPLNPIQEQVTITMMNQDGYEDIPVVMLDGSVLSDGNGLEIQAENVSIEGLSIINFPGNGIYLNGASGSELTRNFLGVETDGVTAAGNGESGILILNGNDVILLQNIVSGNAVHGIYIDASVDLDIFESDVKRTQILENRIGTDYDGLTAIGNGGNGIRIDDSPDNLISGNLVSGNGVSSTNRSGILLNFSLTTANVIEENRIGTTQSGNSPLGNLGNGIALNFAPGNQIQNNIIGSNNTAGITLFQQADDNQIFGNSIGIGEDGATALPNQVNGISIVGSKDNEVGSSLSEHSNTIAYNLANGITILNSDELESINNKIIGNSIFSNAELGINLAQSETDNTVSENDVLDDDEGPNRLQNFPDLASATYIDGDTSLDITYSLSSDPTHSSYPVQIEFFKTNTGERQGKEQLGTDSYSEADYSFGEKTVNLPIPADVTFEIGDRIVATATDNQGNTSEFSDAIFEEVILGPEDFIVVNTNDTGEGSLRWVIENVNLSTEVRTVTFNIPGDPPYTITPQSPLPIVEKPVTINGASQPGYIDGSLNPSPIIELSGINAGTANGIEIRGGNTQIQALAINHFSDAGISISEKGGNEIIFNFIGTNITGDTAASNGSAGIFIDDVPDNVVFGNLISGNNTGIFVQQPGATGNVLEGNTIGLDVTGSVAIPNEVDGVRLANGPSGNGVVDNFISGNGGKGIYVLDILGLGTSNNTLRGNIIGTDALVTARVPNQSDGIRIEQSDNNQIYSNVLSGNNSNGIEISGVQSTGNQISGNIIGLGKTVKQS